MNEEGCATGAIGAEQSNTFIGCIPAFDDHIVQLFATELVDDGAELAIDLEEVSERAEGGELL